MWSYIKGSKQFFVIVWLSIILGCSSQPSNYVLRKEITKYTTKSLNIRNVIGDKFKIIEDKIKDHYLLIKAVTKDDSSYFVGVDLINETVAFAVPDPANDYIGSSFDFRKSDDKLFSLSALQPTIVYVTDLTTKQTSKKKISFNKALKPGQIVVIQNQLYLINDVYGIAVVNLQDFHYTIFHNEGATGIVNHLSSIISLPIDSSLTLLSGHLAKIDTIQLYAINAKQEIKWQYPITNKKTSEAVSLLNYSSSFIVKYDNAIISLDKRDGNKLWDFALEGFTSEIYKWNDKILAYSLLNPMNILPINEDQEYVVDLMLFNSVTGKLDWNRTINSYGIPHIGICQDNLLLSDNTSFRVFSIKTGNEIDHIPFTKSKKNNYSFEMLSDKANDNYYLKSYDDKIFW